MFGPLIERLLLKNQHRVTLELLPDSELAAKQDAEEVARLAALREKMGQADLTAVVDSTKELKERQVREQRLSIFFGSSL